MKTEPDLRVVAYDMMWRVIDPRTGLVWRTLPTRQLAEAWASQCVKEVPCE